jgi:DNA-binding NarL/FixJ family response regulator
MPTGPTTLLICDDHKILTDALAMVVERNGSLRMIAAPVHVPEEAIELCRDHQPDVVLMDNMFKASPTSSSSTPRPTRPTSGTCWRSWGSLQA